MTQIHRSNLMFFIEAQHQRTNCRRSVKIFIKTNRKLCRVKYPSASPRHRNVFVQSKNRRKYDC